MQGGGIAVTSQPGAGSTFAFYIKARRSEPNDLVNTTLGSIRTARKPTRVYTDPSHVPTLGQLQESPTNPEPGRVGRSALIVEDNLVNQKVLKKQLEKLGWVVNIANHGVEALEYLKHTQYWKEVGTEPMHLDVILMDIEMVRRDSPLLLH
jgi:hypothetical protein